MASQYLAGLLAAVCLVVADSSYGKPHYASQSSWTVGFATGLSLPLYADWGRALHRHGGSPSACTKAGRQILPVLMMSGKKKADKGKKQAAGGEAG